MWPSSQLHAGASDTTKQALLDTVLALSFWEPSKVTKGKSNQTTPFISSDAPFGAKNCRKQIWHKTYEMVNAWLRLSSTLKSPALFLWVSSSSAAGKGDELLERLVAEVGLYTTGDSETPT